MLRHRSRTRIRAVASIVMALVALCMVASAETRPFVELVPDDVASFTSVPDYPGFLEKFKATPYYALLSDPEVKALWQQVLAKAEMKGFKGLQAELGVTLDDLLSLPKGEFAFATVLKLPGGAVGPMQFAAGMQQGMLWLADVGADPSQAQGVVDRIMTKAAQEKALQLTEEEFGAHKIHHLTIEMAARPMMSEEELSKLPPELQETMRQMQAHPPAAPGLYVCLDDNVLAVAFGQDRSLLEGHLTLRDGGDLAPLANSALYKQMMAHVDTNADYVAFQSFEPMWEVYRQMGAAMTQTGSGGMPDFGAIMDGMGIFDLKACAGSGKLAPDGISSEGFILAPAPRRGLLKAFVPSGTANVAPPAFVGSDAAFYAGAYFDVQMLWEEIKGLIAAASPEAAKQMETELSTPGTPGALVQDLLNSLGTHAYVYSAEDIVTTTPEGSLALHLVLAIEAKDAAKAEQTFDQLRATQPAERQFIIRTEVEGKTVYQIPPPLVPMPTGMGLPSVYLFFADGKLIVTGSDAMCRQVIQDSMRKASPLLSDIEFRGALAHLTKRPAAFFYMDCERIGGWFYGLAKKFIPPEELSLPAYEAIGKYLSISVGALYWDDEGIVSKGWMPNAELPGPPSEE